MSHVLVETIQTATGEGERETPFNAPAIETQNARLAQLGAFRDDTVGANQAASAMTLASVEATAPTDYIAGRAGTIVGVVARMVSVTTLGAIISGSATFRATVGGVAVGTAVVLSSTLDTTVATFTTPVDFAQAAKLGVTLASASLSPTTSLGVAWLLIRWAATSV